MARTMHKAMASGKKPSAKKANAKKLATSSRSQVNDGDADDKAMKKRNRNTATGGKRSTGRIPY